MQRFEHAIETDRRIDAAVAEEFFTDIFARLAEKTGVAFIAEEGGEKLGWALLAACEEWARSLPVKVLMISVLEGNKRAATIYRKAGFATYYVSLRKCLH